MFEYNIKSQKLQELKKSNLQMEKIAVDQFEPIESALVWSTKTRFFKLKNGEGNLLSMLTHRQPCHSWYKAQVDRWSRSG